VVRKDRQIGRPYLYFDLGETIVNLRDTIGVIASEVAASYPSIAGRAKDCAKSWFLGLASEVPRNSTAKFETQYEVGSRILARVLRDNGLEVNEREAGRLLRTAWNRWQDRARLCEGVTKGWLREVGRLSAGVGAVTDGDEGDVRRLLDKIGLSTYFDSVTTSEAVGAYKPNPVVYRTALASLGADARRSLFVSDSLLDLTGAIAVGMTAVWFHREAPNETSPVPPGTLRVTHPDGLPRILARYLEVGRFEM
jgi:2-haloalkanoic acid dehalogenase type II